MIKNNFLKLLINLLLLSKNDIPLPLNSRVFELGVLQNIADNVDSYWHILSEALGIVDGLFPRGVGIKMRTNVLDLQFERMLRSPAGSLKRHVFKEMSSPIRLVCLRP